MATPSGTIFDTGVTQYFIPEMWADSIYKYFEEKLVFKNLVDDYSSMVKGKGDTIHFPEIAKMTAASLTDGAQVSYVAPAETETQLTVNQHYYAAKLFTDVLAVQSQVDLFSKYSRAMGYSLAKQLDSSIAGQLITVNEGVTLATDDQITANELEGAIANLGENDVDYTGGDVYMVVNPTVYADMLNPGGTFGASFVRADIAGYNADNSPIHSGQVGQTMGMPVFMSNSLSTGGTNVSAVIFHRSACAVAVQQDLRVQDQYDLDVLGTKVVADLLWGVKKLDDSDNKRGFKFTNAS
jgi:hypothetical protein